jgi:hypothetical protein
MIFVLKIENNFTCGTNVPHSRVSTPNNFIQVCEGEKRNTGDKRKTRETQVSNNITTN